ncbi:MAG: polysulfide reductase NrfD [Gammaproteobacteria bacterium]|nr:polysulfide reductase NrfD [Gammaproteobacteria bacterium]
MASLITYSEIKGRSNGFLALLGSIGLIVVLALFAFHHMESEGHYVTGMSNQVVWGLPHVFAIFLIVAASGALNVASIGSVFGKKAYKPLGRLSALLAIALLAGGLMVLVLDLGRPDRLIVAMTYYNFKSIFTWNILLYNGFFLITGIYLWLMMERRMQEYSSKAGLVAFVWRLILTTGTGSIFGFLVARQGYDAAILGPMFVIMSFSFGLAIFILVLMAAYHGTKMQLGDEVLQTLTRLLGVFVASVLYISVVYHLTNLYATEHQDWEKFILLDGGIYTFLIWFVSLGIGTLAPLYLIYSNRFKGQRKMIVLACILVLLGAFSSLYVIIIGGQAFPLTLFPGKEVSSSFYDGMIASYTPSIWEFLLGIGGIAVSIGIVVFAMKLLPLLPSSLADSEESQVS